MNEQFKKLKMSILFLIVFSSSIIFISPVIKSGPLDPFYECTPNLVIEYDQSILQEPIIPFDKPKSIPVKVNFNLLGPAVDIVLGKIGGNIDLIVDMSIAEVPEGCYASITPPILLIKLPEDNSEVPVNATISITINQNLPASLQKKVVVRMSSRRLGKGATLVKPGNFTQELPFTVGYYPQLSFVYNDGNVRNISPDETAEFNFEIQNWGNGATNVISGVEDLPDDWVAEIIHSTVLGSELAGSTSSKTISLRVKPPIDFGYHEDRAIIKISMTPVSYVNPQYKGEPLYLYFIVQSKGFFTPGFDITILLFSFLFVIYPVWKIKSRNNEKKSVGGKR